MYKVYTSEIHVVVYFVYLLLFNCKKKNKMEVIEEQLGLTPETSKKRGSSSLEEILKYVGTLYGKMKERKGEHCQTKKVNLEGHRSNSYWRFLIKNEK